MYNNIESEHFAVIGVTRVAVSQGSLKSIRKEAGAQKAEAA